MPSKSAVRDQAGCPRSGRRRPVLVGAAFAALVACASCRGAGEPPLERSRTAKNEKFEFSRSPEGKKIPWDAIRQCSANAKREGLYGAVYAQWRFMPGKPVALHFDATWNLRGRHFGCVRAALEKVHWEFIPDYGEKEGTWDDSDLKAYVRVAWERFVLGEPTPLPIDADRLAGGWRAALEADHLLAAPLPPDLALNGDGCIETTNFREVAEGLGLWLRARFDRSELVDWSLGDDAGRVPFGPVGIDLDRGLFLTVDSPGQAGPDPSPDGEDEDHFDYRVRLCASQVSPFDRALLHVREGFAAGAGPAEPREDGRVYVQAGFIGEVVLDGRGHLAREPAACILGNPRAQTQDEARKRLIEALANAAHAVPPLPPTPEIYRFEFDGSLGIKLETIEPDSLPGYDPQRSPASLRCGDFASSACQRPAGFQPVAGSVPALRRCLEGMPPSIYADATVSTRVHPAGGVDRTALTHVGAPVPNWFRFCVDAAMQSFHFPPAPGAPCDWTPSLRELLAIDNPALLAEPRAAVAPDLAGWAARATWGDPRLRTSAVAHVAVSSDGALAANAGRDRHLRIWETRSGRTLRDIPLDVPVERIAFAPGAASIAVDLFDGRATEVYDAATGTRRARFSAAGFRRFSSDGRFLVQDGEWDRQKPVIRDGSSGAVRWPIASNPDSRLIAISANARAAVYEVWAPPAVSKSRSLQLLHDPNDSHGRPRQLVLWRAGSSRPWELPSNWLSHGGRLSADGRYFFHAIERDGSNGVRAEDLVAGRRAWSIPLPRPFGFWMPTGSARELIVASSDRLGRVDAAGKVRWEREMSRDARTVSFGGGARLVVFSPSTQMQAEGGCLREPHEGSIRGSFDSVEVLDGASGQSRCRLDVRIRGEAAWDAAGKTLVFVEGEHALAVASLAQCKVTVEPGGPPFGPVTAAAYSPDGSLVAIATPGWVQVRRRDGGAVVGSWSVKPADRFLLGEARTTLAFSGDAKRLAVAHTRRHPEIEVYDVESGRPVRTLDPTPMVLSVGFVPRSTVALVRTVDSGILRWDWMTGETLPALPTWVEPEPRQWDSGSSGLLERASFIGDLAQALAPGGDFTARIWDLKSGAILRSFSGAFAQVVSAAVSRDGSSIATGDAAGEVRLWNARTGECTAVLQPVAREPLAGGQDPSIRAMAFSADSSLLAAASALGWVRTYSLRVPGRPSAGEPRVLDLTKDADAPTTMVASPDGRELLVGTALSQVHFLAW